MHKIIVIVHDIRSCHNVGSLLRTAEGFGVEKVYFTGYSPYPPTENDERLPHISRKLARDIHKTALGAEDLITWEHQNDISKLITRLKLDGFTICALEQSPSAIPLPDYTAPLKVALLLGREVEGIDRDLLTECDELLEIPMAGKKESFNVVQAAAIALYHLTLVARSK